jgi:hypothetical protein
MQTLAAMTCASQRSTAPLLLQDLARAEAPKDFIRHGRDEAWTEITLASDDPRRPIVVQRRVLKDNTSRYKINGEDMKRCAKPSLCYAKKGVVCTLHVVRCRPILV